MGQYHVPVNLDRMETINPHRFGDGIKLMEFGSSGYGTMAALGYLLAGEGRWAGQRIAIVGDYAEAGDLDHNNVTGIDVANLYYLHDDPEHDVSDEAAQRLVDEGVWTYLPPRSNYGGIDFDADTYRADNYAPTGPECIVVNLDRQEAINPADLGDSRQLGGFVVDYFGGTMTALAVLLACSNGRGGGDFHNRSGSIDAVETMIGRWAGQRIAIVPVPPSGITEGPFRNIGPALRRLLEVGNEARFTVEGDTVTRQRRW